MLWFQVFDTNRIINIDTIDIKVYFLIKRSTPTYNLIQPLESIRGINTTMLY